MARPESGPPRTQATTATTRGLHARGRWWLLAAGVLMVGLLSALSGVLQTSMKQAQLRHAHTAARAAAGFRCNVEASLNQRRDCLARAESLIETDGDARR